MPSRPAPSEPGPLPRSPARPGSVWRSHSALTRRAGPGSRKSQRAAPRGCRVPRPRRAWVLGLWPAGASGARGLQASTPRRAPTPGSLVPGGATGTVRPGDAWHGPPSTQLTASLCPPPSAKGTSLSRSCRSGGRRPSVRPGWQCWSPGPGRQQGAAPTFPRASLRLPAVPPLPLPPPSSPSPPSSSSLLPGAVGGEGCETELSRQQTPEPAAQPPASQPAAPSSVPWSILQAVCFRKTWRRGRRR